MSKRITKRFITVVLLIAMVFINTMAVSFADSDVYDSGNSANSDQAKDNPIVSVEVPKKIHIEGQGYFKHNLPIRYGPYIPITYPHAPTSGKYNVGLPWIVYTEYPNYIKVTTKSGNVYEGFPYDVVEAIGEKEGFFYKYADVEKGWLGYYVETDQSYENQWTSGIHPAKFHFMGFEQDFEIEIKEFKIDSIIVGDRTVYSDEFYKPYDPDYGDDNLYDELPSFVEVTIAGKTYKGYGALDELRWMSYLDDYNENGEFVGHVYPSDPSQESIWDMIWRIEDDHGVSFGYCTSFDAEEEYSIKGVGTYDGIFYLGATATPYKVNVVERPEGESKPAMPTTAGEDDGDDSPRTIEDIWQRLSGQTRYSTMSKIVEQGWYESPDMCNAVIVATGENFKDALSAAGFAGRFNSPIILTDGVSLSVEANSVLKNFSPSTIYVAGGPMAVSDRVLRQIETATGIEPKRIAGKTSAETSAELALKGMGMWEDNTAIIATNRSFKDALSAAPIAYAKSYPILLADNGKSLSQTVLDALKTLNIGEVIIVGGELAVDKKVEQQLKDAGIAIKTRLAGKNGTETSLKIAEWGLENGLTVSYLGIATSRNFPDALAGAALCGLNESVLVLVDDLNMDVISLVSKYKEAITRAFVFGGESAVGKTIWDALINSYQGDK